MRRQVSWCGKNEFALITLRGREEEEEAVVRVLSSAVLIPAAAAAVASDCSDCSPAPPTADWEVINLGAGTTFYLPAGAPPQLYEYWGLSSSLHTGAAPLTIWVVQDTASTSGRDRAGLEQIGHGDGKMTAESSWRKMQEQSIAFKQTAEKEELIFVVFCGHQMQICWSQLTPHCSVLQLQQDTSRRDFLIFVSNISTQNCVKITPHSTERCFDNQIVPELSSSSFFSLSPFSAIDFTMRWIIHYLNFLYSRVDCQSRVQPPLFNSSQGILNHNKMNWTWLCQEVRWICVVKRELSVWRRGWCSWQEDEGECNPHPDIQSLLQPNEIRTNQKMNCDWSETNWWNTDTELLPSASLK